MREILFRGKRKDNSEWVEGAYYHQTEFYGDADDEHHIIASNDELEDNMMECYRVIPKTVGQYTGLTDKNRTKIFEGDIVEVWYKQRTLENNTEPQKYKAIIVFGNPNGFYSWGYQLKMIDDFPYNNDILLWVEMEDTGAFVEVIGNIHDNSDLLVGK